MPKSVGLVLETAAARAGTIRRNLQKTNFTKMVLARLVVVEGLLADRSLLAEPTN